MKKIKSFFAHALVAMVVLAGFGFGVIMLGFAVVMGGAVALAVKLGGADIIRRSEKRDASAPESPETGKPDLADAMPA